MTTFSLIPRLGVHGCRLHRQRGRRPDHRRRLLHQLLLQVHDHENTAKAGGLAVKGGTGLDPGYLASTGVEDAFRTF
jgi:hypothetical protein